MSVLVDLVTRVVNVGNGECVSTLQVPESKPVYCKVETNYFVHSVVSEGLDTIIDQTGIMTHTFGQYLVKGIYGALGFTQK